MKKIAVGICLLGMCMSLIGAGQAEGATETEQYPGKNVTAVIPYNPGGGSDTITRIIDKYISDSFNGKRFDFVYRTGAGGAIGATEVAKSKPDGYTIGAVNIPHIVLQSITETGDFQVTDFDYLSQVAVTALIFVTPKNSPYKSLDEFIAAAKKNPGSLTVGCPGALGDSTIAAWMLKEEAGIDFTVVNYKGGSELLSAILGEHVDAAFSSINMTIPEMHQMNLLATTFRDRNKDLPDIKTFKEFGYNVVSYAARVYVAPAGLDPVVKGTIIDAFESVYNKQEYQDDVAKANFSSDWMPGDELGEYVIDYQKKARQLIDKYYKQ